MKIDNRSATRVVATFLARGGAGKELSAILARGADVIAVPHDAQVNQFRELLPVSGGAVLAVVDDREAIDFLEVSASDPPKPGEDVVDTPWSAEIGMVVAAAKGAPDGMAQPSGLSVRSLTPA